MQECSINYPENGPLPPDAPSWCQAPFDPEGLLRSVLHNSSVTISFSCNAGSSNLLVVLNVLNSCFSSVMAIVTCLIGLQFGHIIIHFEV